MKNSTFNLCTRLNGGLCKSGGAISGRLLTLLTLVLLMVALTPVHTNAQVYGSVWDSTTKTLTFKDCSGLGSDEYAEAWSLGEYVVQRACSDLGIDIKDIEIVVFDNSFAGYTATGMYGFFEEAESLREIKGLEYLNTSQVTNMKSMFEDCSSLTQLDLSNFDTSKVTNMSYMFEDCSALTQLDVSKFNTSKVTNMSDMFDGCSSLTQLDVSKFNTSKVTNMTRIFSNCSALTAIDVSKFNTSNVTSMFCMFNRCSALTQLDLSNFDTSKVTDMNYMFCKCSALTAIDVSNFNTSKVTNMNYMFCECSALTAIDVSNFNTSKVTNMGNMFEGCSSLTTIDVSNFNTSNVTSLRYLFYNCPSLTELDLSSFNTSCVTNMRLMFGYCHNLKTIYISDLFTVDNVNDDYGMFYNCSKLPNFTYNSVDKTHAHYKDGGYMQTYCKVGDNITPISGDNPTVANLVLIDGEDFVAHAPFTAEAVSYSRDIAAGTKWNTLCLPFEVSLTGQNFRAFKLLSATDDAVELEQLDNAIPAGTPVIIGMNDGETALSISEHNQTIVTKPQDGSTTDDGALQLVGLYTKKMFSKATDGHCYILKGNQLMNPAKILESTSTAYVGSKALRAYMMENTTQPSQQARAYNLGVGDVGTAIDTIEAITAANAEYYDLQGHRLNAPLKGVNIVRRGGKTMKVIIK